MFDYKMFKASELTERGVVMAGKIYDVYWSPHGKIKIGYTDHAINYIKRMNVSDHDTGVSSDISKLAKKQLDEYFSGTRKTFNLPIEITGTAFQKRVWTALCDIPYGETRSYKEIAMAIGNGKAARAVGMANNKNPVTIVIPCHRVIGSNGRLVGYAGGLAMKEKLLELERGNN